MSSCRGDFTASGPRKNRTSRFPPGSEESQAIHIVLTRRTNAQTLVETSTEPTIVYVLTMVAGLEKEKMSGGRKFWRWLCGAEVFLKKRNMYVFIRISYVEFGVSGNTPPLTSRNVVRRRRDATGDAICTQPWRPLPHRRRRRSPFRLKTSRSHWPPMSMSRNPIAWRRSRLSPSFSNGGHRKQNSKRGPLMLTRRRNECVAP